MSYFPFTRRRFLQGTPGAVLGSSSIMSTLLSLKMANNAVAAGLPSDGGTDRKTIVCVFLYGGSDSYNILVPRDDTRHQVYQDTRTDLALPQDQLRVLNQIAGGDGQLYGSHPATPGYQEMFNGIGGNQTKRRLSFITNIGTLVHPTTREEYENNSVALPQALFAHNAQTEQWQTSLPQGDIRLTGWAGRIADVLHCTHNQQLTSMSLSLNGNRIFQVGRNTTQFVMNQGGALQLTNTDATLSHPSFQKNLVLKSMMQREYAGLMEKTFAELTGRSIDEQEFVQQKLESLSNSFVNTPFPKGPLGDDLKNALRMIKLRPELGLRRQTIFIGFGGWDHHGNLAGPLQERLEGLDPALLAFQEGLEELGLEDSVITFTASDFGRTLRSNGGGSDHAWGGNQAVFGGPVDGGKVCGTFPDLTLRHDNPAFVSQGGRLIPTTSVDEFIAELLLWFGLEGASNFETVLPNLDNFFDVTQVDPSDPSTFPIGFLKPGTFGSSA